MTAMFPFEVLNLAYSFIDRLGDSHIVRLALERSRGHAVDL